MDRGLWISWYDLPADGRDAYCKWVNEKYIPKILKHKGVLYGAHYASDGEPPASRLKHTPDASVPTGNEFILVFGGETAQVFSHGKEKYISGAPARLEADLTDEDRTMLALRKNLRVCIMAEVARRDGPEAATRKGVSLSPCMQLGTFNAESSGAHEDELLTWYADWRFDALGKLPGCVAIRQIVSVSGWAKHGVLYEFTSRAARDEHFPHMRKMYPVEGAWTDKCTPRLNHTPHSPIVSHQLFQAVK